MLSIKNLSVIYPDKTCAIEQISLTIGRGERVAIIGANGAGKTSLILALVGIIASEGEIEIDGIRLTAKSLARIRAMAGVVFQNPDDQLFMPSIGEDVAFGLRNLGCPAQEISQRVETCLRKLDIWHLREKTPLKLSGGEKRMAALATVLVMEPRLMIFDEPTAFLDPCARRKLIETLNSLPETQLIATHDLSFAAETCSRVIILKNGSLFADGPASRLLYDSQLMEDCGLEAIQAGLGGSSR